MSLCPANCGSFELLANPISGCSTDVRQDILSRLALWPCNIELPDILPGNIKPLFDDGTIVATSELGNFTINDPVTEEINISACRPNSRVISTREIVFQDRIAITVNEGSPVVTNKFWDYDVWKDKLQYNFRLYSMWIMCSGDVIIPVDKNGDYLPFDMFAFINWQQGQNAGSAWVEFKQVSMIYRGDPFYFNKPSFNINEEGIIL